MLPELGQSPDKIGNGKAAILPIRYCFLHPQTIEIDRHIEIGAIEGAGKLIEMLAPILAENRAASLLIPPGTIVSPRMHFQPAGALGTMIPENVMGPPAFEIAAAPNVELAHVRKIERAIDPTATSPFRRANIPVGMIIEGNNDHRLRHPAQPERSEIMEVARTVEDERRESRFVFAVKIFYQRRRRGKAKRWSPILSIDHRDLQRVRRPRRIEIEMHRRFFHARELPGSLELLMETMNHNDTSDVKKRGQKRKVSPVSEAFRLLAHRSAAVLGTAWAFAVAVLIILVWGVTGPTFHFSDTWQLIINTGTTIVTFLMVFLIQNTQNRDAKAVHLKLDELIRAMKGARNKMVDLEKLSDDELQALEKEFHRLHQESRDGDTHVVKIEASAN